MTAPLAIIEPVGLPSGTLTFLLSDVEGSTHPWEVAREAMATALPRSLNLVEEAATAVAVTCVELRGTHAAPC